MWQEVRFKSLVRYRTKYIIGLDYHMDNLDNWNSLCNRILNAYKTSIINY